MKAQKILILYLHSSALDSRVMAWSSYDGTARISPVSGDEDEPLDHNIWHAGRRNASDRPRAMYQLRFNPTVRQTGHWDMSTYDAAAARVAKPLHSPHGAVDDLQHRLSTREPRADVRGGYPDIVQRNKLWRLLSGDDAFSVHHWLTRVENVPGGAIASS
ncbi:MAG: hypothetical protein GY798_25570 [Hyphomicrobiales bacterium]|nr:hypothetical protein [Hyphomicrobiales bacterium]